eukprot:g49797.t1
MRPTPFLDPLHEHVYPVFKAVGFSRVQFKSMIAFAFKRRLAKGSYYIEQRNEIHQLSMLVEGRLLITRSKEGITTALQVLHKNAFVESPWWSLLAFARPGDDIRPQS